MQHTETLQNVVYHLLVSLIEDKKTHKRALEEAGGGGQVGKSCLAGGCWELCEVHWGTSVVGSRKPWQMRPLSCFSVHSHISANWNCRWCLNASLHQHIITISTAIQWEGKRILRLFFVDNNKTMCFNIESCHLGQLFSVLCLGH